MNDAKLKEALQKQDEYLFFWGHLENVPVGDDTFNDLSRDIIAAYKTCHKTTYLGSYTIFTDNHKKKRTRQLS